MKPVSAFATTGLALLLAGLLPACAQGAGQAVAAGEVTPVGPMQSPRAAHSSSALPDGRVLLAGGCIERGCEEGITASTELFDPQTRRFQATGTMAIARVGHRAVRQPDGGVLVIGGWTPDGVTALIERYDPETGKFSRFGDLLTARDGFTATVLDDGRILIAGGYTDGMRRLDSAEILDPRDRRSLAVGSLRQPRMSHTATRLQDGRVLLVGGTSAPDELIASIEMFDPDTDRFSSAGQLQRARHKHAATLLPSGQVLIIGGAGTGDSDEQFNDSELYSAKTGATTTGPEMTAGRFKFTDAVLRLSDGRVLVAGSGPSVEVYDPAASGFGTIPDSLDAELSFTSLAPLPGDRALITGGYDEELDVAMSAWIYEPDADQSGAEREITEVATTGALSPPITEDTH